MKILKIALSPIQYEALSALAGAVGMTVESFALLAMAEGLRTIQVVEVRPTAAEPCGDPSCQACMSVN